MNQEQILKLIENPLVLLVVMYLGGLGSIAKQIRDARRNGNKTVTYATYFGHRPEMAVAMGILLVSYVGMIESHTLNFMSAWLAGYTSNSLADLAKEGGRSAALAPTLKTQDAPDKGDTPGE